MKNSEIPFEVKKNWPKHKMKILKANYSTILPPFSFHQSMTALTYVVHYSYPYYVHVFENSETFSITTNFKFETQGELTGLRIILRFPIENPIEV